MNKQTNNWDAFAILLIDVQQDFMPETTSDMFPQFSENTRKLVSLARRENIEIIHLHAKFKQDQSDWMVRYKITDRRLPCIEGTPGVEVMPCAEVEPGETVIIKNTFDGFCNPELDNYLQKKGKRFLLTAGLITSVCVLLTSASATQRGYIVGVVEDCCADRTTSIHNSVLDAYPFIFERVTVDNILSSQATWLNQLKSL